MKRGRIVVLALVFCLALMELAYANGVIILPRPRPEDPAPTPMSIKYARVETTIDNQTAVTNVDEAFYNPNNRQLEGIFIFPLPANASISNFSMFINGKEEKAELLDVAKARQMYEDIVRRMIDPALLEYVGTKAFKLRIFPIMPNEEKRIKFSYTEVIERAGGVCAYRYPHNTNKYSSTPLDNVAVRVCIKSNIPLKSIFSPSHSIDVTRKDDCNAVVGYEAKNMKPDKDFILYYTLSDQDVGINVVTFKKESEDGYFMILLSPKHEITQSEVISKDIVFVSDSSSSMQSPKMDQARKALEYCVNSMKAGDRFNIIDFSTEVRPFKDGLVEVNESNMKAAREFIGRMEARGATNIHDALVQALAMAPKDSGRPYMIVFITDGEPTCGETTDFEQILKRVRDKNAANVRIFCFGVGHDVNSIFLDRLADENFGARDYITPEENIEVKVASFNDKVSSPVLTEVKLEIPGVETYDRYPMQLPDLFRGSQLVVYGRYRGGASTAVRLSGKVNGQPRGFTYDAKFPSCELAHNFIPRLWAMSKIGYLLTQIRLHGEKEELKQEVVRLAKEHGIITPYTSYLVLEDIAVTTVRPARPGFGGLRRELEQSRGDVEKGRGALESKKANADAVAGARELDKMKGGEYGGRSAGAPEASELLLKSARNVIKYVAEKTFYFDNDVWCDSAYHNGGETTKVKYMSDQYFELLGQKPELGKYFALGKRVIVVLSGTIYEVVE
jgi:Ca-activated chloride channel family protein